MEEDKESDEVDEASEDDEGGLMKHLVIKKDDDLAIDLIRADGSSKRYSLMIRMLQGIDREDLEALWKIVKAKYSDKRPGDEFERVLWGDLKVMFEPDIRSDVWRILQGYKVHNGNYAKCAAGEKITTADYNSLKTFYCQEDTDGLKR
ncbi:hypothetical protein Tco_0268379 [Tanacetum coccineum]